MTGQNWTDCEVDSNYTQPYYVIVIMITGASYKTRNSRYCTLCTILCSRCGATRIIYLWYRFLDTVTAIVYLNSSSTQRSLIQNGAVIIKAASSTRCYRLYTGRPCTNGVQCARRLVSAQWLAASLALAPCISNTRLRCPSQHPWLVPPTLSDVIFRILHNEKGQERRRLA